VEPARTDLVGRRHKKAVSGLPSAANPGMLPGARHGSIGRISEAHTMHANSRSAKLDKARRAASSNFLKLSSRGFGSERGIGRHASGAAPDTAASTAMDSSAARLHRVFLVSVRSVQINITDYDARACVLLSMPLISVSGRANFDSSLQRIALALNETRLFVAPTDVDVGSTAGGIWLGPSGAPARGRAKGRGSVLASNFGILKPILAPCTIAGIVAVSIESLAILKSSSARHGGPTRVDDALRSREAADVAEFTKASRAASMPGAASPSAPATAPAVSLDGSKDASSTVEATPTNVTLRDVELYVTDPVVLTLQTEEYAMLLNVIAGIAAPPPVKPMSSKRAATSEQRALAQERLLQMQNSFTHEWTTKRELAWELSRLRLMDNDMVHAARERVALGAVASSRASMANSSAAALARIELREEIEVRLFLFHARPSRC
jgi:hypothetical protein